MGSENLHDLTVLEGRLSFLDLGPFVLAEKDVRGAHSTHSFFFVVCFCNGENFPLENVFRIVRMFCEEVKRLRLVFYRHIEIFHSLPERVHKV